MRIRRYLSLLLLYTATFTVIAVAGAAVPSVPSVRPAVSMCRLEPNGDVNRCEGFNRYITVRHSTIYLPVRCDNGARNCILEVRP